MTAYYTYLPSGKVMQSGLCGDDELEFQAAPGESVAEGVARWDTHFRNDLGEAEEFPARPGLEYTFDYVLKAWVDARTLEEVKVLKNLEINASRLSANRTTFTFSGKEIACDELSRSDIDATHGQVLSSDALPSGWPGAWKAADNTYVSIPDVTTWKSLYEAMVYQGMTNFGYSQVLKSQLAAATTIAEVNLIAWG